MNANASLHAMPRQKNAVVAAFTLIELLVVIAIIGILAAVGLPAIRGMTKSNAMIAGNRQLLDDVAYARQRAIADHTTVYVVFIPTNIISNTYLAAAGSDPVALKQYTNLLGGQYTTYALLSLRSVGEQPGRATPHFLTDWCSLPNGVFIATNKYAPQSPPPPPNTLPPFPITNIFPFPRATNLINPALTFPYVGFDYLGRLVSGKDEYIPLARGSVFYSRDAGGNFNQGIADPQENPLNNSIISSNVIHIDWLTGKARTERLEVK